MSHSFGSFALGLSSQRWVWRVEWERLLAWSVEAMEGLTAYIHTYACSNRQSRERGATRTRQRTTWPSKGHVTRPPLQTFSLHSTSDLRIACPASLIIGHCHNVMVRHRAPHDANRLTRE